MPSGYLASNDSLRSWDIPQVASRLEEEVYDVRACPGRNTFQHGFLHLVHGHIASLEQFATLTCEMGATHRPMGVRRFSVQKATILQRADHLMHCLGRDKGTTCQLRIGVAAATTDETQRRVLGNGQLEGSENCSQTAAKTAVEGPHGVAEAGAFKVFVLLD